MTNMAHTVGGDLAGRAEADARLIPHAAFPTHAERARTIVALATQGSLATVAKHPEGYPFGSIVLYALDGSGRPIFSLSDLAEHSKNLAVDPRASLLVTEPPEGADALASGRVTLVGPISKLEGDEATSAREAYMAVHPHAYYVDFDDFSFYRLDVEAVRYVGGFGMMSWVDVSKYSEAEPDPVAPRAGEIIEHMNSDHADAVLLYAQVLAQIEGVDSAAMMSVDRYGFDVVAQKKDGPETVRITFDQRLDEADQVRGEMIKLLGRAREAIAKKEEPDAR